MCDKRHTILLEMTIRLGQSRKRGRFRCHINNMTFIKCLFGMSRYQTHWALNIKHRTLWSFVLFVRAFFYSICCVAFIFHFTSACCEWIFYSQKKKLPKKIWFAIKIIIATRAQLLFYHPFDVLLIWKTIEWLLFRLLCWTGFQSNLLVTLQKSHPGNPIFGV